MAQHNPYVAPRAAVDDAPDEFQPVRIFSVSGRIGRARYILYTMGLPLLVMFVIGLLSAVAGAFGVALMVAGWVAVVTISMMLTIQRSHDFDMSGWFALIGLVPLANLAFWFIPGTDGANRYGAKTSPNGAGVLIAVWIVPALFIGGILAAIAIPAYSDYQARAAAVRR
jgi:uncharacterized membrane protein YhaH (DUF805 family)